MGNASLAWAQQIAGKVYLEMNVYCIHPYSECDKKGDVMPAYR